MSFQHGVMTTPDKIRSAHTAERAVSSVQSVSRKLLARRKAAKERNSKVGKKGDWWNLSCILSVFYFIV